MNDLYLEIPTKEREQDAMDYIIEFYANGSVINGSGSLDKHINLYDKWLKKLDDDLSHTRGFHQNRRLHQGPGLRLFNPRPVQVFSRSQEACRQRPGRHRSGLSTPPLRLVRQAPRLDPDRLRGVLDL